MKFYAVRWDTFGSHGAYNFGYSGKFATLEEALQAKAKEEADSRRQPLADTDHSIVFVTIDEYGNHNEVYCD